MGKVSLKNVKGDSVGDYDVPDRLLVLDKGEQAVHESVVAFQAHRRAGTASTLSKSQVSGSGKKPWKQKGLGRARAGYKQSPIWRGGAVAHGPKPRTSRKKLSKKVARLAFQRAFSAKVDQGDVTVIDELVLSGPKTREFAAVLKNLGLVYSSLIVVDAASEYLLLASRNIRRVDVVAANMVNTYQILRYKNVIVTKAGMEVIKARLDFRGK